MVTNEGKCDWVICMGTLDVPTLRRCHLEVLPALFSFYSFPNLVLFGFYFYLFLKFRFGINVIFCSLDIFCQFFTIN